MCRRNRRPKDQMKGGCIMVKYTDLSEEQKKELLFTEEERKQLDEAKKRPITYDKDCPAVTPEKAMKFIRVNAERAARRA